MATQPRVPRSTGSGNAPAKRFTLADTQAPSLALANRYGLHAREGWGKCLGRGTPVLMYDGTVKSVEDIEENELLMGPDSKPRLVTGLHRGTGPLFRIVPTKGMSFVVNAKHVLSLKMSRSRAAGFHELVNIPLDEYLQRTPCFHRDAMQWRTGVEWDAQPVPIDPYLLGCWLGDGTSTKPDITTADECVVDAMRAYCAGFEGMEVRFGSKAGAANTWTMRRARGQGGSTFMQAARTLNVVGNKHIPWVYKANSREARLQILAGLIDTDGHAYTNCIDIVQKRRALAEDILFIARSLGLAAYMAKCVKHCRYKGELRPTICYRVKISGETQEIPARILRKRCTKRGQRKSALVTGFTVEPIGEGEFFGFEVDSDHLFLLGDFTVTHNTSIAAHAPKPIFIQTRGETGLDTLISNGQLPQPHISPRFPAGMN